MNQPEVKIGQWIKIGKSQGLVMAIDGYVLNVYPDGVLGVGYYQDNIKAVKEDVIWNGEFWEFKSPGPDASYLRGPEETTVKRGPRR